jgi:hypothetical protein
MSISIFGLVFLPIALWVFFSRPHYLVPLLVLSSVFAAASVVDVRLGESVFGLQPFYFTALLVACKALPRVLHVSRLKHHLEPSIHKLVSALLRFWKWAVLSAFLFPVIFKGTKVIDPRNAITDVAAALGVESEARTLHWGLENLGQAVYLTLCVIALLYVVVSVRDKTQTPLSLKALRTTVFIVSAIAVVQSLAVWRGWPFPYDFFNSNPGYAQNYSAMFQDLARVNATFTEASYAGGFMAAAALGLLATRLYGGTVKFSTILLALLALVLTTATTGYAAFLLGGALLFLYLLRSGLHKASTRRLIKRSLLASVAIFAVVALLLVGVPQLRQAAIESTFNKADTVSAAARLSLDAYSLKLMYDTYGLGAGLGSNRPSSLGADLLGNIGIIGTVLFAIFLFRLFAQLLPASRQQGGTSFALVAWMLVGLLIAQGLALPDLSWPPLWAILIAATSLLVSPSEPSAVPENPSPATAFTGDLPQNPALA